MQSRKLGNSALTVSPIGVGFWGIVGGDYWGAQDETDTVSAVNAALDAGINFFDTAEGYGDGYSEEMLGRALKGRRDEAIIASKVAQKNLAPDDIRAACERSLKRLQTDVIDLYQAHWPNRDVPFEDSMATLLDMQRAGKIRVIGVSNFGELDMPDMLRCGRYDANQLPYSLLWRAIEFNIQPQCVDANIGILPYSPLNQALLTGRYQDADEMPYSRTRTRHFRGDRRDSRHGTAGFESETFAAVAAIREICADIGQEMVHVALAWLLHKPAVTSVLAGARNPAQVESNRIAGELRLSEETMRRLDDATDELKLKLGPDPDMWGTGERSRYR
ncbi:MAG: aldo/keto reductase [Chloroflexota bacterium]|nr:aldo/keto reductase [Chloroflexota bacterium]MDE2945548.1 aldo/keto reductase [Chloroflexota bacterium]